MVPSVDMDGKIIMKSMSQIQMLKNGSGALFELISENKEVRDVLGQTKFIQVFNMSNDVKHVLDPQFLGMASVEKLQAALKCVKRDPKEDDTLVKM